MVSLFEGCAYFYKHHCCVYISKYDTKTNLEVMRSISRMHYEEISIQMNFSFQRKVTMNETNSIIFESIISWDDA